MTKRWKYLIQAMSSEDLIEIQGMIKKELSK